MIKLEIEEQSLGGVGEDETPLTRRWRTMLPVASMALNGFAKIVISILLLVVLKNSNQYKTKEAKKGATLICTQTPSCLFNDE